MEKSKGVKNTIKLLFIYKPSLLQKIIKITYKWRSKINNHSEQTEPFSVNKPI